MLEINIKNGGVRVSNNVCTPKCLDISVHLRDRALEVKATHWPAHAAEHVDGARDAYISLGVKARENAYESKDSAFPSYVMEQDMFFDVEQARAMRDALSEALAEADAAAIAEDARDRKEAFISLLDAAEE